MRFFHLFLLTVLMTALPAIAHAGDDGVAYCGAPTVFKVDPGNFSFCDIYSRQIAYRSNSLGLHRELVERQRNYATASRIAHDNYVQDLQDMYKQEREKETAATEDAASAAASDDSAH